MFGPIFTSFRVSPFDLDAFGHMTNSRYFAIMDVGRTDLIARTGILPELKARGWFPVVVEEVMHFRRALNPWVKFRLKTEVIGFDDRHMILQQTFLKGDKVAALGLVRARFLGPDKQKVSPQELLELTGLDSEMILPIGNLEQERYQYLQDLMEKENEKLRSRLPENAAFLEE